MKLHSTNNILLRLSIPKFIYSFFNLLMEDFDECFVFGDDFLLGFDLGDALLMITDYADYTDLAITVYKYMRMYLYSAA